MFLDLLRGVLEDFAEYAALRGVDREDGLHVMAWPSRPRPVTEADFPRLEREARAALPRRGAVRTTRARGPQRVGAVSRGVARRADPEYRARERVRQARAARERRRRARELRGASSGS